MREEVAAYLRSVASLYPGGIPRASLSGATRTSQPKSQKPLMAKRIAFLSLESEGVRTDPFEGAAGALLRAAIEKGLKIPVSDVEVIREARGDALTTFLKNPTASFLVVLGDSASQLVLSSPCGVGEIVDLPSGVRALRSLALSEVSSDQTAKRAFWTHLQLALKEISRA